MNVFAVSKVRLDNDGRVTAVLWGRVNTETNQWATPEVVAPVIEVVHAIHAVFHPLRARLRPSVVGRQKQPSGTAVLAAVTSSQSNYGPPEYLCQAPASMLLKSPENLKSLHSRWHENVRQVASRAPRRFLRCSATEGTRGRHKFPSRESSSMP